MAAVSSSSPDWPGALARAHAHSPFLSRALERLPDLESLLEAGDIEAALLKAKAGASGWRWRRRWRSETWRAGSISTA
jgi:hypothetical protein